MKIVVLVALLQGAIADLPRLSYKYASFAVAEPESAAKFLAKYTNGTVFRCGDLCAGVTLAYDTTSSAVYFRRNDSLIGNVTEFGSRVGSSFTMAQDDWVWWQDWHIAFIVSDIDALAMRLMNDNIPFISRGSLYFLIENTAITIQVLGSPTVYWTESFLFCRKTNNLTAALKPYPLNVTPIVEQDSIQLPQFVPSHQSLATSDAELNGIWFQRVLNVSEVDEDTEAGGSHAFAGGTCAKIKWYEIDTDGWEIHFIEQFNKRDGGVSISDTEKMVRQLNGPDLQDNAFQQFHVGLSLPSTNDLMQYIKHFDTIQEPYRVLNIGHQEKEGMNSTAAFDIRLRIAAPSGYIFEIFVDPPSSSHVSDTFPPPY